MITNECNYSCAYCIENTQYKENCTVMLDIEQCILFVRQYAQVYPANGITIRIYGGEPTLHPDLIRFC